MDIEITRKTTLDEIRTIFENIATNQISILSVSCDGATEAQLEAIAFELAENQTLKDLSLNGVSKNPIKMNWQTAEKFSDALSKNSTIISLSLGNIDPGPGAIPTLSQFIETNSTITKLYYTNCHFEDIDIQPITDLLALNTNIESIGITDSVKNKDLEKTYELCFKELMQTNKTITFINAPLTIDSIADIRQAAFKNKLYQFRLNWRKLDTNKIFEILPTLDQIKCRSNGADDKVVLDNIRRLIEADPHILPNTPEQLVTVLCKIRIQLMMNQRGFTPEMLNEKMTLLGAIHNASAKLFAQMNLSKSQRFNVLSTLYSNHDPQLQPAFAEVISMFSQYKDKEIIENSEDYKPLLNELIKMGTKLGPELETKWQQVQAQLNETFNHKIKLPLKGVYALFIDGDRQTGNPDTWMQKYDDFEPNCLERMHGALNNSIKSRTELDSRLGEGEHALNLFKKINDDAMKKLYSMDPFKYQLHVDVNSNSEFGSAGLVAGLPYNRFMTLEEFQFLFCEQKESSYNGESMWSLNGTILNYPVKDSGDVFLSWIFPRQNPDNVQGYLKLTLNNYYNELKIEKDPLKKLELLAKTYGRLERLHPRADGNTRTSMMWMNTELMNMGFPPAIMDNPNKVASQLPNDVLRDMISGMQTTCKTIGLEQRHEDEDTYANFHSP